MVREKDADFSRVEGRRRAGFGLARGAEGWLAGNGRHRDPAQNWRRPLRSARSECARRVGRGLVRETDDGGEARTVVGNEEGLRAVGRRRAGFRLARRDEAWVAGGTALGIRPADP